MNISDDACVLKKQCATCPFRNGGLDLGTAKMAEINKYLAEGVNHFCHSDSSDKTICRGGRNFQLSIWSHMGLIAEPTDEALRQAMRAAGVEPRGHV